MCGLNDNPRHCEGLFLHNVFGEFLHVLLISGWGLPVFAACVKLLVQLANVHFHFARGRCVRG